MSAPRISLCMIVRDEAERLPRCLAAARGAVDEVCVVDTGSRDGTAELAERLGARVRREAWRDSFAEARNASLEMATGDWILVLDADEVLEAAGAEELRALARRGDLAGALLRFTHRLDGGTQEGWVLRFFRNHPEHRFVGGVHEQLAPAFEERAERAGQRVLMSDVRVEHDGYLAAVREARGKDERNRRLFERSIEREPENLYLAFKYADFLRGQGESEHAMERLADLCRRIEARPPGRGYAFHGEAFALLAIELIVAGRIDEAGDWLARAGDVPATAHLHFARGCWCSHSGRWEEALEAYAACRSVGGPAAAQVPSPGVTTWKSGLGLAEALERLGRAQEAEGILERETLRSPDVPDLFRARAVLLRRADRAREAVESCLAGLRLAPRDGALWILCGELMLEADLPGNARAAAERAVRYARPGGPDGEWQRAEALRRRCAGPASATA